MNKGVAEMLVGLIRFIPGVPPVVVTLIEKARQVDTPEEFYGSVQKLITVTPVGGEK